MTMIEMNVVALLSKSVKLSQEFSSSCLIRENFLRHFRWKHVPKKKERKKTLIWQVSSKSCRIFFACPPKKKEFQTGKKIFLKKKKSWMFTICKRVWQISVFFCFVDCKQIFFSPKNQKIKKQKSIIAPDKHLSHLHLVVFYLLCIDLINDVWFFDFSSSLSSDKCFFFVAITVLGVCVSWQQPSIHPII